MIEMLIFAVSLRFFLFEIKFEGIREKISRAHFLFETFLGCAFCNGFWCGVFTYLVFEWSQVNLLFLVYFALSSGVTCFFLNLFVRKLRN